MQRIKQTKQDFIVLLSETKETLDEQLALPQVERDTALIAECLETLDYIKGEANLPEGAFAFDSFQFFARNSSPSILCKEVHPVARRNGAQHGLSRYLLHCG